MLRELHKKKEITKPIYDRLRSLPPRLYGLPKIHKQSVPLRPIVSCIGFPSYKLFKYIASIISPLAGKTSSHVRNSKHFAETIRDVSVGSDESLVSFDVTSLFTNVPIEETFIGNGMAILEPSSKQRTPREPDDNDNNETERPSMAYLLYVAGVSERIGAGTSTSERCLSPGPPSAAFS